MNPRSYAALLLLPLALLGSYRSRVDDVPGPVPFVAAWPEPDQEARPWTRWWWPGNALTPEDARREVEAMAEAGLGGVELTPIYGSRDGRRTFRPFLSTEYMETLDAATRATTERGMGFDMCTGTGWPFGGPAVTLEDAAKKATWAGHGLRVLPTGQRVKRAAPGGEGFVLDPFLPAALQRYLAPFTHALGLLPRGRIRCQTHDSFEYYDASWTPDLPERFRERFGYALDEAAAAIFQDPPADPDKQERARYDYRLLLAERHLEYIRTWRAWCRNMGFLAREQAHGAPANLLDLYGAADIPEMETFGARDYPMPGYAARQADPERREDTPDPLIWRFAASAAHAWGKPLVSCETCTWIRNHWHATPADIKPFLDELFCAGINHVVFHGWCFSPPDAPWPGWYFYAAEQFNPRNPLWPAFVDMFGWITRTQSLLQASEPDNDLLLLWPFDDALTTCKPDRLVAQFTVHDPSWALDAPFGVAARLLVSRGYGVDYVSDATLESATVEKGKIRLPGGLWRALVVPRTVRMRPETLARILDLAEHGAVVAMESLPETVPGLGNLAERRQALELQCRRVTDRRPPGTEVPKENVQGLAFGQGTLWLGPLEGILAAWREPAETLLQSGLTWIRRRGPSGCLYYLACLGPDGVDGWVDFARGGQAAVFMDPVSGRIGLGATRPGDAPGTARVYLQARPGESLFVVFPEGPVEGNPEPWRYYDALDQYPADAGPWTLRFESGVMEPLPGNQVMPEPRYWTDLEDPACQAFAGTATYRAKLRVPALRPGEALALHLDGVRHAAWVRLDDTAARPVWCQPFRVVLDPPPDPGEHDLEITVFSLGANAIRALERQGVKWKVMDDANIVDIRYKPLDASGWPVVPSGLAGPVTLEVLRPLDPGDVGNKATSSR
ncbi:MAG TPA: glycosyl hydrolase [Candidatus Hydrogenedentes bacterium]|nr:glycosyl hydrolase [Candidatus Hydrogenedentota bacterium]